MITLIASMVGFLSSIIPDVLKILKSHKDNQHQINVIDQQIRAYDKGITTEFEAYKLKTDNDEAKNLYTTYKSGIRWVDTINASVRPSLAYAFFALYAFIKYKQFILFEAENNLYYLIDHLWTVDDQAIFAGIISFYFGQRAFIKRMNFSKYIK